MSLAVVAVGSIAASAVVGAYGANKAAKNQSKAIDAQSAAAEAATQLGYDQLEFDKQVYNDGKDLRDRAGDTAIKVSEAQLASQQQNDALAAEYADYNRTTFRPLEQGLVSDAQAFDTPGRRAQASAEAQAGVESNFGASMQGLNRALQRTGVSVGDGRYLASMRDAAFEKAKAVTGATSAAEKNVETQGWARKMDAASLGRGLPSAQATSAGIALNAGNSAVGNGMQALNAQMSGAGLVNQGYSGALQGMSTAGSLYGQAANQYGQQAQQAGAGLSALGSIAGQWAGSKAGSTAIAGWLSSEDKKSGTGKPIDTATALKQIEATTVDEGWRYDPTKGGPDEGGQMHDGPMAAEVRRTMGDTVAPKGQVIDAASMNGRILAGMQELTKRIKKLERMSA